MIEPSLEFAVFAQSWRGKKLDVRLKDDATSFLIEHGKLGACGYGDGSITFHFVQMCASDS